ncbi:glycosyltransferase family 4 protein [Halarcobacter anaerophilus]|uniref:Glycosyl transferase family 1 domain-containing protein n=1 Tax=Halarcobacter anaerophilus TaxID=877500 RepID=A0A4Q0Y7Z4_9BACT|nr:glycosyltransferase family 4 protein [Halarcobacter anaerophilus]QDF29512.1 glycosyltransferase, family 1 [Halarcobacter anaerophilus]RXJ64751.1 hypothetical protein CRV06_02005 [Halarcobacter anaerophilus]
MKILLISNMYPSKTYPSYGVFIKNTKELLEKQNVEFVAQSSIYGRTENKFKKIINYIRLYLSFFCNVIFKKFDVAYIHFFGFYSVPMIYLLRLLNKKIVVNIHGTDLLGISTFTFKLQKKVLNKIDLVIIPSKYFKNKLINKFPNISEDKIYIYPSGGINTKIFYPQNKKSLRKKHNLKELFTIGYVSHINNNKGWHEFLQATEKFKKEIDKDIQIIIVGTGQHEKQFEQELSTLTVKENIKRYKKLTQIELSEVFNLLDLYIFPTKREDESLGLVGLEAMSCGVPVIGSNIAGVPSYLEDEKEGFLVRVGDIKDIYEKIFKYYNLNEEKKVIMKQNAIKKANQYEANNVSRLLKEKFEKIMK